MIYLLRHGRTQFNDEGRVQGALDSPLTPLGVTQAAACGARLRTLIEDPSAFRLQASPLGRAQQSAALIADALGGVAIETDPRLAEVSVGVWEGMTDAEIEHVYPGARDGIARWDWYFHSPGGESFEAVQRRLGGWLAEAEGDPRPRIAVSHGVSGRVLRGLYLNLPRADALRLAVPQDAFFKLEAGAVERIETALSGGTLG